MARDPNDELLKALTPAIRELLPGKSTSLAKVPRGGSLEARRVSTDQVIFYYRYTLDQRTQRVPIGPYDARVPKALKKTAAGYSIVAAWEAAKELGNRNADTPGGLRAAREREQAAQQAAQHEAAARQKYTLHALCTDYCDWLQKKGKPSHKDARNIFSNHLIGPYPALAAKPARAVEKHEIVAAVRRLTEAGMTTTARKLRAYLRAAYAVALKADSDTQVPETFIHYRITENPLLSIAPIKGGQDKNPLTVGDLRRYWKALKTEPDVRGAALRLQVLTGGQRIAQLARLHAVRDVRGDTLQLWDSKGKRDKPRPHLLPITDAIRAEVGQLPAKGYVLSTDGGTTPMHPSSLSAWAAEVGARAGIDGFQLKRVRSGIETMLAEAGIPLHLRGQLQSHGISGVQATHYDAHEYLPEKRAALDALHQLLERKEAKNVTPIRRRRA